VSNDILYGIITTSDIMKYLGSKQVFDSWSPGTWRGDGSPVRKSGLRDLYTHLPRKASTRAAREMLEKCRGSPVIEKTRLVGLVTEFDMVKALGRSDCE